MPSFRDSFNNYHQNAYFIDLYKEANVASPLIKDRLIELLIEKNLVDLKLYRKDEIKKNFSFYATLDSDNHLDDFSQQVEFSHSNSFKNLISDINSHRLDMVWSRTFIEVLIMALNTSAPELSKLLQFIAIINGVTSYAFYCARGGVDLVVGLKGLKLSDEDITFQESLAFQWRQRYYRICNDLVLWAPVNYLTFQVLTGDLKFYGDVITAVLLAGDFILSTIKIWEKISTFNKIYAFEQQRLKKLNLSEEEINVYLTDLKNKHAQKLKLDYAFLMYQFFLIVAFIVLCSSPTPFMLIGAISCFLLQLVVNQIESLIKLSQMTEGYLIQQEYIKMFGRLCLQLAIPALFLVGGYCSRHYLPCLFLQSVWPSMWSYTFLFILLYRAYVTNWDQMGWIIIIAKQRA